MSSILSKSSSTADVVAWLQMNNFGDEVIDKFEGLYIIFHNVTLPFVFGLFILLIQQPFYFF